jgi:hypothetical protein
MEEVGDGFFLQLSLSPLDGWIDQGGKQKLGKLIEESGH